MCVAAGNEEVVEVIVGFSAHVAGAYGMQRRADDKELARGICLSTLHPCALLAGIFGHCRLRLCAALFSAFPGCGATTNWWKSVPGKVFCDV